MERQIATIRNVVRRRTRADRWIMSLGPLYEIIDRKIKASGLGKPRLEVGPAYMEPTRFDDNQERIRRGAVWFVDGHNTGFHVDFLADRTVYEAWTSERRVSMTVAGKVSPATLDRDLGAVLLAAGIDNVDKLKSAREQIMPVTRRRAGALEK